jgi:hypothetical protein
MALVFTTTHATPEKRRPYAVDGIEERLTEAAVMLAIAFHILNHPKGSGVATICPDGEHAKQFEIAAWLAQAGFRKEKSIGGTAYGGYYVKDGKTLIVNPRSGQYDVSGEIEGVRIGVECKGAIINSTHSGARSRNRKGICEVVGMLLAKSDDGIRQIAAVPSTVDARTMAERMAHRCNAAGIELVLLERDGGLTWVGERPTLRPS